MKYKLLACDIDGTLFGKDGVISNENVSAIKKLNDLGVYFVLSTGRPKQAVEKYVEQLSLDNCPLIINNGATVTLGDEIIYNLTVDDETSKRVIAEGRKIDTDMICWSENRFYAERDCESVREYAKIPLIEPIFVKDLTSVKSVTKFIWFNSPEKTLEYYKKYSEAFKEKLNVLPSRANFLEFYNKSCSKAIALEIIGKKLNILPEETVAVGDGFNDLAMIEFAGLGVAMENAPTEVKDKADFVTLSCEKNGVKALIDRFF